MQNVIPIADDYRYVGANDRRIALFENLYPVPQGAAYNSYLLLDEKTVLFDTVDAAVAEPYLENVEAALAGRPLDYLVVHHVEPDHSATFLRLLSVYPSARVIASAKAAQMLANFFPFDQERVEVVGKGTERCFGKHTLVFFTAPMVHWPEVLFSYDKGEKILFSADAFGSFGANDVLFADEVDFEREVLDEARRYYFNIVGKYGAQVQAALKKAATLEIGTICPLHGHIWRKDLGKILEKYELWSKYLPEERRVAVFYGTIYGHTGNAAEILASAIAAGGAPVSVFDVSKTELSVLLAEAFRCSHVVFASATHNNGVFPGMERLLTALSEHGYCNRSYSVVENGSWSPQAGALIERTVSGWKGMKRLGEGITILSSVKEDKREALLALGALIAQDVKGA